jgi:polyhydroxyalkanoate synthesis regulator phasin
MFVRVRLLAAVFAVAFATVSGVSGQSLGDVAKKEQQRRKTSKNAGKVYTNKDLGPSGTTPPAPAVPPSTTAGPGGAETAPAEPDKADEKDPKKTEEYWRERLQTARANLQRDELFLEALQSRVNALSTDFVNRDDPAQRAVIGDNRQKTLAEMDRVRQEIDDLKKQIADIEEEARQAGVPPGWLR